MNHTIIIDPYSCQSSSRGITGGARDTWFCYGEEEGGFVISPKGDGYFIGVGSQGDLLSLTQEEVLWGI